MALIKCKAISHGLYGQTFEGLNLKLFSKFKYYYWEEGGGVGGGGGEEGEIGGIRGSKNLISQNY